MQIRADDHALLQPMFLAKLVDANGALTPQLITELTPDETAPAATPFK
jgi:branched-chain amino acid transport system substrate-binding protein